MRDKRLVPMVLGDLWAPFPCGKCGALTGTLWVIPEWQDTIPLHQLVRYFGEARCKACGYPSEFWSDGLLPIGPGTRIQFLRDLYEGPCEDHAGVTYAHANELGTVTRVGGCWEGYWVNRDRWFNPFGCRSEDFRVIGFGRDDDAYPKTTDPPPEQDEI